MNDILFWWLLFTLNFSFGYILGSKAVTKDKIRTLYQNIKDSRKHTSGVVRKLTPAERRIKGTVQQETEDAMTDTLDQLL